MEAAISHEDPDPLRLCVKFNIAEPRFEVSKISGFIWIKVKHTVLLLMNLSVYMKCLYLWHDILRFLLEFLYVLYDFMYLAVI